MKRRIIGAAACAISLSVAAVGTSSAQTALSPNPPVLAKASAEWMNDVTVLAIAPDGTWGTATESSFDRALVKAIADCKSRYRHELGCGYRSVSVRVGWILAMRCGRENIIVAAKTLRAAEQAAINSELDLRRDYKPDMPPCVRVVSVTPDGGIVTSDAAQLLRLVMENGAR